jgi:hypothetical protein
MLCGVHTGRTKGTAMHTLRRIAVTWRGELLAAALLTGGLLGMATGAY